MRRAGDEMGRIHGQVLAIGVLAGVLGDLLFRGAALGLNAPLWLSAVCVASWIVRRGGRERDPVLAWLLPVALFFAGCLAWRASPFLRFWNGVAVLGAAVAITVQLRGGVIRAGLRDYLAGATDLTAHLAGGAGAAAAGLRVPGGRAKPLSAGARATAVGMALAVPVVFVFGGLLTAADPVLEAFVTALFAWEIGPVLEHALFVLGFGWLAAGWLWAMRARQQVSVEGAPPPPPRRFGLIEIAVPLGALALLLAAFIGIQASYLFGGEALVRSTGLTYATLARRGFFELVFLSMLVVPLLYVAQWVLDRSRRTTEESFRALLVVLALLVGLVMVSAFARMRVYVTVYGLTEDRLYATAFMVWIGFVLTWLVITELRSAVRLFVTGALLAGFAILAQLNVLNPDALIARTNIARAERGHEVDAAYLGGLSVDAIPPVAAAWEAFDGTVRCALQDSVLARLRPVADWREWTWSNAAATRATSRLAVSERCG